MLVDIDTRKLSLKKGDILICNGKEVTTISKVNLLEPLWTEIKKDKKRITDLEILTKDLNREVKDLIKEATL
jgi:hypothetical protein